MARLVTMFIILIAIQACILLYHDSSPMDNALWTFVNGMDSWGSLDFVLAIFGIAAGLYGVGIAVGTIFGTRTDTLIFASAVAGFLSIGYVFSNLAGIIRAELIGRIFTTCIGQPLAFCTPVNLMIAVTIGPFALYYVMTVWDWWKGRDM